MKAKQVHRFFRTADGKAISLFFFFFFFFGVIFLNGFIVDDTLCYPRPEGLFFRRGQSGYDTLCYKKEKRKRLKIRVYPKYPCCQMLKK